MELEEDTAAPLTFMVKLVQSVVAFNRRTLVLVVDVPPQAVSKADAVRAKANDQVLNVMKNSPANQFGHFFRIRY
jgi:hypothetical protein